MNMNTLKQRNTLKNYTQSTKSLWDGPDSFTVLITLDTTNLHLSIISRLNFITIPFRDIFQDRDTNKS